MEVPLQSALGVQRACSGQRRVYTDLPIEPQIPKATTKTTKTFFAFGVCCLVGRLCGWLAVEKTTFY